MECFLFLSCLSENNRSMSMTLAHFLVESVLFLSLSMNYIFLFSSFTAVSRQTHNIFLPLYQYSLSSALYSLSLSLSLSLSSSRHFCKLAIEWAILHYLPSNVYVQHTYVVIDMLCWSEIDQELHHCSSISVRHSWYLIPLPCYYLSLQQTRLYSPSRGHLAQYMCWIHTWLLMCCAGQKLIKSCIAFHPSVSVTLDISFLFHAMVFHSNKHVCICHQEGILYNICAAYMHGY